jgi:exo-beta-1,3-glucanase (GH17 family)
MIGRVNPLLAVLVTILLNLGYWAYEGREQPVPDAGTAAIPSISFSPYLHGATPYSHRPLSADDMAKEIELLSGTVGGLRTYSSLSGQEAIPRIARPFGMKVMQGAWVGREPDETDLEIDSLINLANRYPEVIDRVIVGNEVLLRRDLTRDQLAGYIRRVKRAVKQPVTYADVWEFWLKNRELARDVDIVTIHILPYWEDQPIPIEHAMDHVMAVYRIVQAAFPGKPIAIGEIGWPSQGRMRAGALPSPVNEARFVREFMALSKAQGLDYNLFEAFDQPWKRGLEGSVGAYWGLWDKNIRPKFELSGPVSNDPAWLPNFAFAAALGTLALLFASHRWRDLGLARWLAYAAAAQGCGSFLVSDARFTALISLTAFDKIVGGLGLAGSVIVGGLLMRALGEGLAGGSWPHTPLPSAEEALNLLRGRPEPGPSLGERVLGFCQFGFVVAAAVSSLALVIDPRYRDFPSPCFLVPAFGFAGLALLRDRSAPKRGDLSEETLLTALLLFGAAGVLIGEGIENYQAIGWCAMLLLLALPMGIKLASRRRAVLAAAVP